MMADAEWSAALFWLRAQLDVDEAEADADAFPPPGYYDAERVRRGHRLLRQVEAHRAVLDYVERELADAGGDNPWWYADRLKPIVRALALPFAELPDFPEVLRLDQTETR